MDQIWRLLDWLTQVDIHFHVIVQLRRSENFQSARSGRTRHNDRQAPGAGRYKF